MQLKINTSTNSKRQATRTKGTKTQEIQSKHYMRISNIIQHGCRKIIQRTLQKDKQQEQREQKSQAIQSKTLYEDIKYYTTKLHQNRHYEI